MKRLVCAMSSHVILYRKKKRNEIYTPRSRYNICTRNKRVLENRSRPLSVFLFHFVFIILSLRDNDNENSREYYTIL